MSLIDLDLPTRDVPARTHRGMSRVLGLAVAGLVLVNLTGEPARVDADTLCASSRGSAAGSVRASFVVLDIRNGETLRTVECPK